MHACKLQNHRHPREANQQEITPRARGMAIPMVLPDDEEEAVAPDVAGCGFHSLLALHAFRVSKMKQKQHEKHVTQHVACHVCSGKLLLVCGDSANNGGMTFIESYTNLIGCMDLVQVAHVSVGDQKDPSCSNR